MRILHCEQRSEEWYKARLGIPTASEFAKIYTSTGKVSTSRETYMFQLLGEWLTGRPQDCYNGHWMERGTGLEAEARQYYELFTDQTVEQVGFVYSDSGLMGCSPDGLLLPRPNGTYEGGLEIKSPSPGVHISYFLNQKIPAKYVPQVQGSMLITGAEWWEWFSYHPELPPVLLRTLRNETYIRNMDSELHDFTNQLLSRRILLQKQGLKPAETVNLDPQGHVDVTLD